MADVYAIRDEIQKINARFPNLARPGHVFFALLNAAAGNGCFFVNFA